MSDYCYSYPVFRRVEAQAARMDRMLARAGLSPLEVIRKDQGATWYEARTRCIECPADRQCGALLAGEISPHAPSVPDFCPNKASFEAIAVEARKP